MVSGAGSVTGAAPVLTSETVASSLAEGLRQSHLEVRLAHSAAEIEAAQRLRYRIFFDEMGATPSASVAADRRDQDSFDSYCDHLLVLDHSSGAPVVVGTYRLLRKAAARRHGGFYTATEFDISKLLAIDGDIMEVGRACVAPTHRQRPTMQLLWRGIATFAFEHGVKVMFGCGSLPGTDPQALARPLSYLHYNHMAPDNIRVRALDDRYVRTDLLPPRDVDAKAAVAELEARATLSALPPLIKGYLRLGGYIGDGAVIDRDFNTTDVCILVVTDLMAQKYFNHFIRSDGLSLPPELAV